MARLNPGRESSRWEDSLQAVIDNAAAAAISCRNSGDWDNYHYAVKVREDARTQLAAQRARQRQRELSEQLRDWKPIGVAEEPVVDLDDLPAHPAPAKPSVPEEFIGPYDLRDKDGDWWREIRPGRYVHVGPDWSVDTPTKLPDRGRNGRSLAEIQQKWGPLKQVERPAYDWASHPRVGQPCPTSIPLDQSDTNRCLFYGEKLNDLACSRPRGHDGMHIATAGPLPGAEVLAIYREETP
jgi:hypothetical protein